MNLVGVESEIHVLFEGPAASIKCEHAALGLMESILECLSKKERVSFVADPDLREGKFLSNGARVYIDHCYLEYCTPECARTTDAVAAVRAGDLAVRMAAERLKQQASDNLRIVAVRNNNDHAGHSYGSHINIRMTRNGFERIFSDAHVLHHFVVPFFVALPIMCGSGSIVENEDGGRFTVWQRAPFLKELVASRTTFDRPLVNSRDESLDADPEQYARLHVIAFDANVAEVAEFCKLGLLRLLCAAIDAGCISVAFELADPIAAIQGVSRDPFSPLPLASGKTITPLGILEEYLGAFRRMYADGIFTSRVCDAKEVLNEATPVLWFLKNRPMRLGGMLDWVGKFIWLEEFRHKHALQWSDPRMKWRDIQYHCVTAADVTSVPHVRQTTNRRVRQLAMKPPTGCRAEIRGALIRKFSDEIATCDWLHVCSRSDGTIHLLPDDPEPRAVQVLESARTLEEAVHLLKLESIDVSSGKDVRWFGHPQAEMNTRDPARTV